MIGIIDTIRAHAWQTVAALLFLALAAAGVKLYSEKMAHADTRADRDRIALAFSNYEGEQKTLNADAAKEARTKEQELQEAADTFKKDAYVQINRIQRERDAARDSLRNRPSRPASNPDGAGMSAPAGPGAEARGCTGAELFKPDAEFLVGLAADYDELRIEFNKLWDIYQRARSQAETVTDAK